jgi:hypothetical protein
MVGLLEPLINEYSPDEELEVVSNKTIFYNYVYFSENIPVYVGKGCGKRVNERSRRGPFAEWHKQMSKGAPVTFHIVFADEDESLVFLNEIALIKSIGRIELGTGPLFNKTDGGEGMAGIVMSEETKKKMSESRRGDKNCNFGKKLGPLSQDVKHKISELHKGNQYNLGKKRGPCSEETKKKIGDAQRGEKGNNFGKVTSVEVRQKISEALKGKTYNFGKKMGPLSEEHRKKISESITGEKNPNFGKIFGPHSEETKRKQSLAMKGKAKPPRTREHCKNMSIARLKMLAEKKRLTDQETASLFPTLEPTAAEAPCFAES